MMMMIMVTAVAEVQIQPGGESAHSEVGHDSFVFVLQVQRVHIKRVTQVVSVLYPVSNTESKELHSTSQHH